jgi:hypothetical protein
MVGKDAFAAGFGHLPLEKADSVCDNTHMVYE